MTDAESARGMVLLGEVVQSVNDASFRDDHAVMRVTLALERLAVFFGSGLTQEKARA